MSADQSIGFSKQLREDEISLMEIGSTMLRRRRLIGGLMIVGAMVGAVAAFLGRPRYVSEASFVPQETASSASDLAAAANQFGIRLPGSGGDAAWGAPMYVELLRSRALLEPIARDTISVRERGGTHIAVMDLLDVDDDNPERRLERTVRQLSTDVVNASEVKAMRGVKLRVVTTEASASHAIAQRLVDGVNRFNLETRQTQAAAERRFVDQQAQDAERELADAESKLKSFLQRNRTIAPGSDVAFERDRLQREVDMRQELHTVWLKNREEARIRQVRNTPVITVLEAPRIPAQPESRGTALKTVVGAIGGGLLGVFLALFSLLILRARQAPTEETREFFHLVEEVRPRFLRRHSAQ